MFPRQGLMICEPLYLTRSALVRLVLMAITVPLIWSGRMFILTVHRGFLAAVMLVVNGIRKMMGYLHI